MKSPVSPDRLLETHLLGNSDLSRRYRALANEEPDKSLDQTILQAAKHTPARATKRMRAPNVSWFAPLSMAAVLVLMVSLVALNPQPLVTSEGDLLAPSSTTIGSAAATPANAELLVQPEPATRSPHEWLLELERLIADGELTRARDGLKAFVVEHPNARVPQALLDALKP